MLNVFLTRNIFVMKSKNKFLLIVFIILPEETEYAIYLEYLSIFTPYLQLTKIILIL